MFAVAMLAVITEATFVRTAMSSRLPTHTSLRDAQASVSAEHVDANECVTFALRTLGTSTNIARPRSLA